LPDETRLVREREQWRELGRLMYVTFTRPRRGLLLPWSGAMFGGTPRKTGVSFAELWGDEALWASLPDARAMDEISLGLEMEKRTEQKPPTSTVAGEGEAGVTTQEGIAGRALPQLPARVLPHQLAEKPADRVRAARHEATTEEILTGRGPDGDEAIKYGLWWHETMEFMPWTASASEVDRYLERALASAEQSGFGQRGAKELSLLRQSVAWDEMTAWRWVRLTELGVFAPFEANAWMDGVMDLVLHDSSRREVWVLDWKTNRRRADESEEAMLGRLRAEYRDQLGAYARAARVFFPGHEVRLLIFATALGRWTEAG
jgi:ATP-dependent exoDNAse (exonuclease V) beta subunit